MRIRACTWMPGLDSHWSNVDFTPPACQLDWIADRATDRSREDMPPPRKHGSKPTQAAAARAKGVRRKGGHAKKDTRRWSQHVTETSDALDLREGVFTLDDPAAMARSLKRSAEDSRRRKSDPYRSAMSMLTFYINRAGKNLPARRRDILESAKDELRKLYGRPIRK
nr:DUF3175 domain-containing protein [Lysobacter chinensis]